MAISLMASLCRSFHHGIDFLYEESLVDGGPEPFELRQGKGKTDVAVRRTKDDPVGSVGKGEAIPVKGNLCSLAGYPYVRK